MHSARMHKCIIKCMNQNNFGLFVTTQAGYSIGMHSNIRKC